MSTELGSIFIRIGAITEDLQTAINDSIAKIQDFGKQMSDMGANLTRIGETMTSKVSEPIINFGKNALNAAADFEEGLSGIKAVSGATSDEMAKLRDLAMEMGAKTAFSALEATGGIEELIKAGVTVEDILNGGLQGALDLAAAGELDLASAAEIASTALNAFRDDALSVSEAADILAGAANASATDVGELKYGLSQVASVASAVGMSFQDTVTALALFAQNGLKGGDAGTSLKTMLMSLQPVTDKQVSLFRDLGLITAEGANAFFDATGKLKNLEEISTILKDSMAGLTDQQRLSALETIFGSDAIRAANILYKEGAEGVTKMYGAMGEVTAAEVATEKLNNFRGSMESLKGSIETVSIIIGERFLPFLKDLADKAMIVVNIFSEMSPAMQNIVIVIAAIIAGIGPFLVIIGTLAGAIGSLVGIIATIVASIEIILPVVAGVIIVFGAFSAAIAVLFTAFESLKPVIDVAIKAFERIYNEIMPPLQKSFEKFIQDVLPVAIELFQKYAQVIQEQFAAVSEFIINELMPAVLEAFDEWGPEIQEVWDKLLEAAEVIFKAIGEVIITSLDLIMKLFKENWPQIKEFVLIIWEGIKTGIDATLKIIIGLLDVFLGLVKGDWSQIWTGIKEISSGILESLIGIIKFSLDTINQAIHAFATLILSLWNNTWDSFGNKISSAWTMMNGIVTSAVSTMRGSISGLTNLIDSALDKVNIFNNSDINLSGSGSGTGIPQFATGIQNFRGGLALVGEKGPELVNLPSGSSVYSNRQSQGMLSSPITIQNMIVRNDNDINLIARELYNLQKQSGRRLGVSSV